MKNHFLRFFYFVKNLIDFHLPQINFYGLKWWNKPRDLKKIAFKILKKKVRYQPVILPENIIISKKSSSTIVDSRVKLKKLKLPSTFKGKTVLDIGCSEGFFSIEAARRGAKKVLGLDVNKDRLEVANLVKKAWGFENKVSFKNADFSKLSLKNKFDYVFCLAVVYHYHGYKGSKKILDTWALLTDKSYKRYYKNMIKAVKKVAMLTKKITFWEYPFTYFENATKPEEADFNLLAKTWVKEGIYKKVDFIGFSARGRYKDRPLYKAYK
jgi:SAM-dependent methyltransferase